MSKAKEAALKICPPMIVKDEDGSLDDLTYMARTWVQKGYEQAEKDMKERFIQFIHSHYPINYIGWIQDFQKAMEDEK